MRPILVRLGPGAAARLPTESDLDLYRDHAVRVVYGPFTPTAALERQLQAARVLFVGLTPGLAQVRQAIRAFFEPPAHGGNEVSFFGAMRKNLATMATAIGLTRHLGCANLDEIYSTKQELVAITSLLRYAVLRVPSSANDNPSEARIWQHHYLRRMVDELMVPVLARTPRRCLVVPLGKTATAAVLRIAGRVSISPVQILQGLPHPSGANGHRAATFDAQRAGLTRQVEGHFLRGQAS